MESRHGNQEHQGMPYKLCALHARSNVITTSPQTGQKRVLFDAVKDGQNVSPKWVPPEEEQEPNESRRSVVSIMSVASFLKKLHYAGYGLNSQMPF